MTPTPRHRLHVPDLDDRPGPLAVGGEEAHHAARVKRLRPGEPVELFDAHGTTRPGTVGEVVGSRSHPELLIHPTGPAQAVPPLSPAIDVCSPAPKGDRLEQMIDQLSQAGAASWRPLVTERSGDDPPPKKLDRLSRVALESAKQCGRAHLLHLGPPITLPEALDLPGVTLADAGGGPCSPPPAHATLLIGPEGGWTEGELHLARSRAVPLIRLGPHTLRLETAAVVATALLLHAHGGTP